MKTAFWKADWFLGVIIAVALLGFKSMSGVIPGLERWAYDLGVKMTSKQPSDKVAVIAIDETSIANIGRWPWPREVQAKLVDQLVASKAKVITSTIILSEAQKDPGLAYVEKMLDIYKKAYPEPAQEVPGVSPIGGHTPAAQAATPPADMAEIGKILGEASITLNSDVRYADSIKKAGNVLLPLTFGEITGAPPQGRPDKPLPEYVTKNTIGSTTDAGGTLIYANAPLIPIEQYGTAASGIGFLNSLPDEDGAVRFEPLVMDYYGEKYPSLALLTAARALNLTSKDIKAAMGESVSVGGKNIRTDGLGEMYTYFYKDRNGQSAFPIDSFFDVYSGKIPASKYADKIVLIGATAAGVGANMVTPISAQMNPVTTLAHSVSSILQEHFFVV